MSFLNFAIRRHLSSTALKNAAQGPSATAGGHQGAYKLWKKMSFFVAIPAIGLCMLNAYLKHQEEHHKPRPEFIKYDHMYMRNKRFPWGDGNRSFFHNPHTNALPNGYED